MLWNEVIQATYIVISKEIKQSMKQKLNFYKLKHGLIDYFLSLK